MRRIKIINDTEYTRLVEEETLIGKRTVFFANQLNFLGSNYLGFGDC